MFTYSELLSFIRLHGPVPIIARDMNGKRPTVHIRENSYLMTKIQMDRLKDLPRGDWTFAIKIEPSK